MVSKKSAKVYEYTAVFEPEDVGYSVCIPALPGCVSEGDTFEEAQKNIQEAAELYLEDLGRSKAPKGNKLPVISPIRVSI